MIYGRSDLKLERYSDFSFQSDLDDSKSILRYIFILNGGTMNWKSPNQQNISDSISKPKYITVSEVA